MGIRLSERAEVFCVPYGLRNDEGTPEATFVDLKAHPEWIPVLAPCLGWPETRRLLETINAPESPLMSLAADQGFTAADDLDRPSALTSFVTLCFAEVPRNSKSALRQLAQRLASRLNERLQRASTAMQRALNVDALIEVQPTVFRLTGPARDPSGAPPAARSPGDRPARGDVEGAMTGWSVTVVLAAHGRHEEEARQLWGLAVESLRDSLG